MMAAGRPTSFKPEYTTQAKKLCNLGATDVDLADFFGVSVVTINAWKHKHPGFLKSLRLGKAEADERVGRSLYHKAVGYTFDAVKIFLPAGAKEPTIVPYREHIPPSDTACIFWLKNRRSDEWRDKRDHALADGDGNPLQFIINTGVPMADKGEGDDA